MVNPQDKGPGVEALRKLDTANLRETLAQYKLALGNNESLGLGQGEASQTLRRLIAAGREELGRRHAVASTDAAAYIETAMRGRLDDLAALQQIARGDHIGEYSNDKILALGLAYGIPGPIPDSQLEDEAGERLDEYPICVEEIQTFEIVLDIGGPDELLLIECDLAPDRESHPRDRYEIRRVLYRYSWEGSAEVELAGEDRETAEAFARRVVPELAE